MSRGFVLYILAIWFSFGASHARGAPFDSLVRACVSDQAEHIFVYLDVEREYGLDITTQHAETKAAYNKQLLLAHCGAPALTIAHCHLSGVPWVHVPSAEVDGVPGGDMGVAVAVEEMCASVRATAKPPLPPVAHVVVAVEQRAYTEYGLGARMVAWVRAASRALHGTGVRDRTAVYRIGTTQKAPVHRSTFHKNPVHEFGITLAQSYGDMLYAYRAKRCVVEGFAATNGCTSVDYSLLPAFVAPYQDWYFVRETKPIPAAP